MQNFNEVKQKNLDKKISTYQKHPRTHTLREKVLKFLNEHPDEWFYVWEIAGKSCEYGFLSHKTDNELSFLANKGLIDSFDIGAYTAYSAK